MTCRRRPPIPFAAKAADGRSATRPRTRRPAGVGPVRSASGVAKPSPRSAIATAAATAARGLGFQGSTPPHRSGVRGRPALCPACKRPPGSRRHGDRRKQPAGQQASGMNRPSVPNGPRFTHRLTSPSRGARPGERSRSGLRLEAVRRSPLSQGTGGSFGPNGSPRSAIQTPRRLTADPRRTRATESGMVRLDRPVSPRVAPAVNGQASRDAMPRTTSPAPGGPDHIGSRGDSDRRRRSDRRDTCPGPGSSSGAEHDTRRRRRDGLIRPPRSAGTNRRVRGKRFGRAGRDRSLDRRSSITDPPYGNRHARRGG